MNFIPLVLLCALLTASCGDRPRAEPNKNGRHYDEKALALGERTFHTHCSVCHGYEGEGKPDWKTPSPDGKLLPPPLDDKGFVWRLSSEQMKQFIRQGSPDGRGNMPAWQGKLSDLEIDAVAVWITSLWSDATYLQWRTQVEPSHGMN